MKKRNSPPLTDSLSAIGQRTTPPPISWLMSEALKQADLISLAAGFTDNKSLPVATTKELTRQILGRSKEGQRALQYGPGAGNENLHHHTLEHLAELDGNQGPKSQTPYRNLLITHGSQQFLYLVTEALCDPGDIIIVEDPTYFVYLSIMQSHGIEARTAPMEDDGISIERLEETLKRLASNGDIKRLKFIYSVTYFQNPTGITTSLEKKQAVLSLLESYEAKAGHRLYYVEDAAYRELNFPGYQAPQSALTLEPHRDRIIYTGTYSKPFATGIRVGFGILPESLYAPVLNIKGNHDFGTAHFLQVILSTAIETKAYSKQLSRARRQYAKKCRTMVDALRTHFPKEVHFSIPNGGLCLWATLPKRITTGPKSQYFRASLDAGVLYVPGVFAFADDPNRRKPQSTMRLSFGSATTVQIQEGISRLGEALKSRL